MTIGRRLLFLVSLACAVPGCAGSGSGSFLSPSASVGSLKTSLSHMEYENQQLRSQVAKLETDNRQIENRLVQEESANGELSARLDDARTLLSDRGIDSGNGVAGSNNSQRTIPAGQSTRKKRKPPFAQIPDRIDSAPGDDNKEPPASDDLGPQSRLDQ